MNFNFDTIYFHEVSPDKLNIPDSEIKRYMGYRGGDDVSIEHLISGLLPEVIKSAKPRASFVIKGVSISGDDLRISDIAVSSRSLHKNLRGTDAAVLFAATVGSGADRLISTYSVSSPSSAFAVSAIAAAVLEAYADYFNKELRDVFLKDGLYLRPRFSPGYGDFKLEHQKDFIRLTDAARRCGICCTDKLLLTPSKSITALTGISKNEISCPLSGCESCSKRTCEYRRQ